MDIGAALSVNVGGRTAELRRGEFVAGVTSRSRAAAANHRYKGNGPVSASSPAVYPAEDAHHAFALTSISTTGRTVAPARLAPSTCLVVSGRSRSPRCPRAIPDGRVRLAGLTGVAPKIVVAVSAPAGDAGREQTRPRADRRLRSSEGSPRGAAESRFPGSGVIGALRIRVARGSRAKSRVMPRCLHSQPARRAEHASVRDSRGRLMDQRW